MTQREAIEALIRLRNARVIASKLRDAKSTHPWTIEECDLLARLCVALGADE